jgi:hypothetical protein
LLTQTQIANLLHVGRGHACVTLDHFAALFVELAYFFGGFMIDEEMKCANGVSAHFRVDLIPPPSRSWNANLDCFIDQHNER